MHLARSSLADVLFSKGQQRVLGYLFARDGAEHSVNELVRLSGGGWGGVERQVTQLVAAGILRERRLGNQRRVQANPASPVYPELRALAVKLFGAPEVLRRALAALGHRVRDALIFGSYAKGTDRSESDIDLLVVGTCDYQTLLRKISVAERQIGRTVSVRFYSPAEFDALRAARDPFLGSVLRGPRVQLLGEANASTPSGTRSHKTWRK